MREISCPYCKEPLKYSAEIARCSVCRTAHHLACWQQNRHCSVPACEGQATVVRFSTKEKIPHMKILLPLIVALLLFLLFLMLK